MAGRDTVTTLDVLHLIAGEQARVSFGFNQPNVNADGSVNALYHYGVGHGTKAPHMHTGIDVGVPLGTTLRSPLPGVVRCVGNQGSGDWGQGCGSFADTMTGGVGNVTVLTDAGLKLTFGHVNKGRVIVGQRVAPGQAVATSGGMFSPHLHLDVSVNRNGSYWLVDPLPAILTAMGGIGAPAPTPTPVPTPTPTPSPIPSFPGLPDWLSDAALRAAFPLADPTGAVTKAVLAWVNETGKVPWFVKKVDLGAGRVLWRFEGITFLSEGVRVWREGDEGS